MSVQMRKMSWPLRVFWAAFGLMLMGMFGCDRKPVAYVVAALAAGIFMSGLAMVFRCRWCE